MDTWLTLPIRLAAVALLGVCLWVVASSSANPLAGAQNPSLSAGQDAESSSLTKPVVEVGRVLPLAIVFAISFFMFYEWICYRLFVESYRQVAKCGGVARSNMKVDWLWLQYLYCSTDVEFCHAEIGKGQFPLLSQIPRLRLVRLWHVHMPETEVTAATGELAKCRDLQRLEVSGTSVSAIDLGQAGLLESVPQVILD